MAKPTVGDRPQRAILLAHHTGRHKVWQQPFKPFTEVVSDVYAKTVAVTNFDPFLTILAMYTNVLLCTYPV